LGLRSHPIRTNEQQALETARRQYEPTGAELQRLAQMQQEVDRLNAEQRDDFNTMSREQLQRQCLTLERQKEFLKQQVDKKETTENLDRRRWRAKLTVPKLGKGLGALKYPEWVATLTNLEKANGIPSRRPHNSGRKDLTTRQLEELTSASHQQKSRKLQRNCGRRQIEKGVKLNLPD
jgi:hypothetical protein